MLRQHYLDCNVVEAAQKRISFLFDEFENINVLIVNRSSTSIMGANEIGESYGIPTSYFEQAYDKPNSKLNSQYRDALIKTMCSTDEHLSMIAS